MGTPHPDRWRQPNMGDKSKDTRIFSVCAGKEDFLHYPKPTNTSEELFSINYRRHLEKQVLHHKQATNLRRYHRNNQAAMEGIHGLRGLVVGYTVAPSRGNKSSSTTPPATCRL